MLHGHFQFEGDDPVISPNRSANEVQFNRAQLVDLSPSDAVQDLQQLDLVIGQRDGHLKQVIAGSGFRARSDAQEPQEGGLRVERAGFILRRLRGSFWVFLRSCF